MRLNPAITRWVDSFLTDRMASLTFDAESEPMTPITTGIPQGSPVSPILFLLYLKPLFTKLNQTHPHITSPSYIDDICLLTQGTSAAANARQLEQAVSTCFHWGKSNAVAFDDPKSELMHYTNSRNPDNSNETQVILPNGTIIAPSEVQRWLGIWLDRKLSWKEHVKRKSTSAMRAFLSISRLANSEKGLSQSALRQLYQSCITTVADFGSEVWWNGQKSQSNLLQKIQNQALRKIAGAFRTTPIAALEAEIGLFPVDIRLDLRSRNYATRLLTLPDTHPLLPLCPNTFPKTPDNEREDPPRRSKFTPWHNTTDTKKQYQTRLDKTLATTSQYLQPQSIVETIQATTHNPWETTTIDILIPHGTKEEAANQHLQRHFFTHADTQQICFYTDGSQLNNKCGAGIYASRAGITVHESSYYLGEECEVFDAELYGIAKATHLATKLLDQPTTDVWIFCDNQSAVTRMANSLPMPGQEYILRGLNNIQTLNNANIKTHIHWVPGHVSIKGNERADQLAKEGTTKQSQARDSRVSITHLKRKMREGALQQWKQRWPKLRTGRSYEGTPGTNLHPTLRNHKSRRTVSTLIQMKTGHGYNREYLSRIPTTEITTPKCPCGYRTQTPKHLLLYCKFYKTERKKMQTTIKPLPLTWRIAMFTTRGLKASLTFLEETGIATRAWLRGSKDLECDGGWRHGDERDGNEGEDGGRREERAEQVEREVGGRRGEQERGGVG
jgi:ribonuclease HI